MACKSSAAMQHGVTRAVIAFVIVFLAVLVGAGLYTSGSAVAGLLVCVGGVVVGGVVWRDK